jgi:uncharacterized protein YchJ
MSGERLCANCGHSRGMHDAGRCWWDDPKRPSSLRPDPCSCPAWKKAKR